MYKNDISNIHIVVRYYLGYNMPNVNDYPLVEVIWIDAEEYGEVGWNNIKELLSYAKKPCPNMHTVGYCVYRGEEHISLLTTIGSKECSTLEKIPLAFVKEITELKRAPEKNKNAKL